MSKAIWCGVATLHTMDEVAQAASSVPCGKSTGRDSVQAKHLCYGSPTLLLCLTTIFNTFIHVPASLAFGYTYNSFFESI